MIKKLFNEKGVSLVELLVVIALMGIIFVFIGSITIQSLETTEEVRIESSLRDEADIIVSSFIKAIYQTKRQHIVSNETGANGSYLNILKDPSKCKKNDEGKWILDSNCTTEKYGFVSDNNGLTLYIKDNPYEIMNKNIDILSGSEIKGDPEKDNSFEIVLKLQYKSKRGTQEVTFTNSVQPF